MKSIYLIICAFLFLFIGTNTSCQKEDGLFWEISTESENPVIQTEVDGIEFKFCLLNEQGEPSTVFNEGENFSFQFSIKNNTKESLPFYDYGFYNLNEFCAVSSKDKYYGKPFEYLFNPDGIQTADLRWLSHGEELYNFVAPWYDEKDEWRYKWSHFKSTYQTHLNKGKYYTQFAYVFSFGYPNEEPMLETGLLKFKINFEIK